jgi:hypothetical protein
MDVKIEKTLEEGVYPAVLNKVEQKEQTDPQCPRQMAVTTLSGKSSPGLAAR